MMNHDNLLMGDKPFDAEIYETAYSQTEFNGVSQVWLNVQAVPSAAAVAARRGVAEADVSPADRYGLAVQFRGRVEPSRNAPNATLGIDPESENQTLEINPPEASLHPSTAGMRMLMGLNEAAEREDYTANLAEADFIGVQVSIQQVTREATFGDGRTNAWTQTDILGAAVAEFENLPADFQPANQRNAASKPIPVMRVR